MKTIHAVLEKSKDGYGIWFDEIENVFAYGKTVEAAKQDAKDVLNSYIETLIELKKAIPEILQDEWVLNFRFDVPAVLSYYEGILSKKGFSSITGVNASLLSQYLMRKKKPRPAQLRKIKIGIHKLGEELLQIDL